jgi:hypothetical protein
MSDPCLGPPLGGSGLLSLARRTFRAKLGQVGGDRVLHGVYVVHKAPFGRLGVSERTSAFSVETFDYSAEGVGTDAKLASDDVHRGRACGLGLAFGFHRVSGNRMVYSDSRTVRNLTGSSTNP